LNGFVWRGVLYRGRVEFEFKIGREIVQYEGQPLIIWVYYFSFLIIETFLYGTKISDKKIKGKKEPGVVRTKFCGNHGDFQIFFFQFLDFY